MKIPYILSMAAAMCLLTVTAANATSLHTYVSGTGSDLNLGTPTSPFGTLQTAIANTTAGGEISVLSPGDFGPVTINESVTIVGIPGATITFSGSEGIFVTSNPGDTVVLRDLDINGEGVGADGVYWESLVYSNTAALEHLLIDHCTIHECADLGVGVGSESPMDLVVQDTTIQGGNLGVRTYQTSDGSTDTVSIWNCTIADAIGNGACGIFTRCGTLDVSHSIIKGCTIGLQCDTNANIESENNMLTLNGTAINAYTNSRIRLCNCDVFDNTIGINPVGGIVSSNHNNNFVGNGSSSAPNATINTQ